MPQAPFELVALSGDAQTSFLVMPEAPALSISSSCANGCIEPEIVFQLVSVAPSQRELMKYCAPTLGRIGDCPAPGAGADEQHAPPGTCRTDLSAVQQRHGWRIVMWYCASAENMGASFGSGDATGGR